MNYELSERERGIICASARATLDLIKHSNQGLELRGEYEAIIKKLKV